MVFQDYALYPQMTVRQNLAFGLRIRKLDRAEIARRVERAAEMLDIGSLLERKPRELSGGQRQRVALGRALVRDPQVFLMDEPLSNLDAKLRAQTRGEIRRLQREVGTTTVYVTHDQVEAMTMGDRIAILRDGVLEQVGDPGRRLRQAREHLRRRLHRQPGDGAHAGRGRAQRRRARGSSSATSASSSETSVSCRQRSWSACAPSTPARGTGMPGWWGRSRAASSSPSRSAARRSSASSPRASRASSWRSTVSRTSSRAAASRFGLRRGWLYFFDAADGRALGRV